MTEHGWNDELSEGEIARLDALLESPELWDQPDQADEEAIVAAILAEAPGRAERPDPVDPITGTPQRTTDSKTDSTAGSTADSKTDSTADNVVSITAGRRWFNPALSAAAGFLVALIGVAAILAITGRPEPGEVELALAGTDLAPTASATARIVDFPAGTRVVLDVSELEPAAAGTYYEVWLRQDAEVGVSAGTFHLRGGDSEIELWAGVSASDYPLVTVTLQQEAQTESSGQVVLRGLLEFD
ncbi:MAG: anti-sigma factor [Actinomycetota bacterium]